MKKQVSEGVIIAVDAEDQWRLRWWWFNYRLNNNYDVTFIDRGMSQAAREWCEEKGSVLTFASVGDFQIAKEKRHEDKIAIWETLGGANIWKDRASSMQIPFMLEKSPYEKTVWVTLDCQVRGPLDTLFEACEHPSGFALIHEEPIIQQASHKMGLVEKREIIYKIQVMAYRKTPLLQAWIKTTLQQHENFIFCFYVLSHLLYKKKLEIHPLAPLYAWKVQTGINPQSVINHWEGAWGKDMIEKQLQLATEVLHLNLKPL